MFRRQYCLGPSRAWQRGKKGVAPAAPSVAHLQRLRFRPVCSRAKGNTAVAQPTRARLASVKNRPLASGAHGRHACGDRSATQTPRSPKPTMSARCLPPRTLFFRKTSPAILRGVKKRANFGICSRSSHWSTVPDILIYLVSLPHGVIALNRKETTKQLRAGVSASGGSACNDKSETESSTPTPPATSTPPIPRPSSQPFKVRDPSHVAPSH
jgi:hypothetical protein